MKIKSKKYFILSSAWAIFLFSIYKIFDYILTNNIGRGRSDFFTAQSLQILNGKFKVDENFLGLECFYLDLDHLNNQCVGYFSFIPSLIRIPSVLILQQFKKLPSEIRIPDYNYFYANVINNLVWALTLSSLILIIYKLFLILKKNLDTNNQLNEGIYLLIVIPVIIVLISRPFVYEEQILVAILMSTISIYFIFRYQNKDNLRYFTLGIVFASLALMTKITFIAPIIWILLILFKKRQLVMASILLIVTFFSAFITNIIKFNSLTVPLNLHASIGNDQKRLRIYERSIRPEVIPTKIIETLSYEPYIRLVNQEKLIFQKDIRAVFPATNQMIEGWETSSILIFPLTVAFSVVGVIFIFKSQGAKYKELKTISLAFLVQTVAVFSFPGFSMRYIFELFPIFVVFSAVGFLTIRPTKSVNVFFFMLLILQSIMILFFSVQYGCSFGGERSSVCGSFLYF